MPKEKIYKDTIYKDIFKSIVKECGSSIIKLGENDKIDCTERTIRRSLKEGRMTPRYLDQIAKVLNVDARLLSGELHKQAYSYQNEILRNIYLSQLTVKNYPYYKTMKSYWLSQPIEKLLEHILSLFEISFSQFEKMDYESQYLFQYDLFEAIIPVIRKHFNEDAYGRKDMPNLEEIICQLENAHEEHQLNEYAEKIRGEFLQHPPMGKRKSDIQKMSMNELIDLDMHIKNS